MQTLFEGKVTRNEEHTFLACVSFKLLPNYVNGHLPKALVRFISNTDQKEFVEIGKYVVFRRIGQPLPDLHGAVIFDTSVGTEYIAVTKNKRWLVEKIFASAKLFSARGMIKPPVFSIADITHTITEWRRPRNEIDN